jgi:hypothetical protein
LACVYFCVAHLKANQVLVEQQGIFGVPLHRSINYANVAISLTDQNGKQFVYGYVPIVVAKCGVFLKEKGMLTARLSSARDFDFCASAELYADGFLLPAQPPRLRAYSD